MDYLIAYRLAITPGNYSRLKLLFNLYVNRTVQRQDFVAELNLVNRNGAHVGDVLKSKELPIFNFPTLDSAKYFYKLAPTAGPSCGETGINSLNKNYHVSLEFITK